MNWIIIATIAYLLFTVASITDKFLISKRMKPSAYAFFIAALSGLVSIILIPFGFYWPGLKLLLVDLISGVSFIVALIFLFTALEKKDTSRIYPIAGGIQSLIILFLAAVLIRERLSSVAILAFVVIVMGVFVLAFEKGQGKIGKPAIFYVILAAFFIAFSFTLEKYVYQNHPFISGFIWNRLGNLIAAIIIFIYPVSRKNIIEAIKPKFSLRKSKGTFKILLLGQVAGGLGAFLQRYAISLGSVSLVSALEGTRYVFLLALTSVLSIKYPKVLKEKLSTKILVQKIIGILLISLGVFILAINL